MGSQTSSQVTHRRVFYIPGYDPIPPRRYRELYRREGAAQASISGYDIRQSAGQGGDTYGWNVQAHIEGADVSARVEVLVWSDIVRDSMAHGIAATYWQLLRTAWAYIGSGALWRLARLRKGPLLAALYPVGMLLGQLLIALVVARGLGAALYALSGVPGVAWLALGVVWPVLAAFRRIDNRLFAYYLMHDYAYSARWNGAYPEPLEVRMAAFGGQIIEALNDDVDEVLVIGHSSGAHLGISILSDLLRAGRVPKGKLALLTLGHVVPMVSFLPDAARLRRDLHDMAGQQLIPWVDVSAPGDGCSFALCDPVHVTGVAPDTKRWPLVISAAFTHTLSPARWKALRWRFFRLHFQYLCAFDRPGDYDYFRITAGPLTLGRRFAGRGPSKSRIETPRSGYRDMAS